jgi:hypothetical protein
MMAWTKVAPLAERAEACLRSSPYLTLRNVSCEFRDGTLTLLGCLPTYYLKQIAQTVVAALHGVERIDNQIAVLPATRGRVNGPSR